MTEKPKYGVTNFIEMETVRGISFSAEITRDGVAIAHVSNGGYGGCNDYSFLTREDRLAFQEHAEVWAATRNVKFEPEDRYVSELITISQCVDDVKKRMSETPNLPVASILMELRADHELGDSEYLSGKYIMLPASKTEKDVPESMKYAKSIMIELQEI